SVRGAGGEAVRVSIEGGSQVRWNPNGKELFYIASDNQLMAVPIRFVSNGTAVELGTRVGLFATGVGSIVGLKYRQQYVAAPDGQSFVMHSVVGKTDTSPISIILDWT